jgi:hypothetical protein
MISDWAERHCTAGNIDRYSLEYLTRADGSRVRTVRFYMLPKTHKDPPHTGRPIISGNGSPTERGSAFIQVFLMEVVRVQTTFLRDTKQFIQWVEGQHLPASSMLLALDINNMYTEIPLDEAETSVMDAVYQAGIVSVRGIKLPPPLPFRQLLHICLYRNNFVFASQEYLQVRGVPMGSKFSPEIADIVGYCLERRIFAMYDNAIHWMRYRDDCFLFLSPNTATIAGFVDTCNSVHPTLKFKHESSSVSLPFLDTEVWVRPDRRIAVRPYRKPMYRFQLLHRKSCHPPSVFKSIIRGETMRLMRNSSLQSDFQRHSDLFRSKLVTRSYTLDQCELSCEGADFSIDRAALLSGRPARD